jgi:integrase
MRKRLDLASIKLEGPAYENFSEVIKSAATKTTYEYLLKQYMVHRKFKAVADLLKGDPAAIQKDIIDYVKYLKNERHLSFASRQTVVATFQKFYSQNDIVLNWIKIHGYLGEYERTVEDRAYTREEIRKLLDVAPLRARVLILLLASSGLRRGAVPGIKRKHLIWIEKYQLYEVVTYPKARERYVTFCSPEASKEINAYFAYREQCGEVLNDESPLIREDFDVDDKDKVEAPRVAANHSLKCMLVRLVRLAGVKGSHQTNEKGRTSQRSEIMLSHGLRKFYDSNLVRAEINPIKVSALMGHRSGLQRSYLKLTDEELLEEYVKAVNNLTINDENRLKLQVKKLQVEKDELIEILRNRLEALERANETRELVTENVDRLQKPVVVQAKKKPGV